jgi:hypothetical protein
MVFRVPGSNSVRHLFETLQDCFGEESFHWIGESGDRIDAIGWRLVRRPRYLFSVSTHAGEMPDDNYDLQVSIVDDSLENGDIVLLGDMSLEAICKVVAQFESGEIP